MCLNGQSVGRLTYRIWLDFAAYCGLPAKAAATLLSEQIDALSAVTNLIQQSFLPAVKKEQYSQSIIERTEILKKRSAVG